MCLPHADVKHSCRSHLENPSTRRVSSRISSPPSPTGIKLRESPCLNPAIPRTQRMAGMRARAQPPNTFLTLEEAGLVEMAGLDMHERFLARLTVRERIRRRMFCLPYALCCPMLATLYLQHATCCVWLPSGHVSHHSPDLEFP